MGESLVGHIPRKENVAKLIKKVLYGQKRKYLVSNICYVHERKLLVSNILHDIHDDH